MSDFYFAMDVDQKTGEIISFLGTMPELPSIEGDGDKLTSEVRKLPDNFLGGREVEGFGYWLPFNDQDREHPVLFLVPREAKEVNQ